MKKSEKMDEDKRELMRFVAFVAISACPVEAPAQTHEKSSYMERQCREAVSAVRAECEHLHSLRGTASQPVVTRSQA